jgi:hypothetical protein
MNNAEFMSELSPAFLLGSCRKAFAARPWARSNLDFCAALGCLPARLMWKLSIDIAD